MKIVLVFFANPLLPHGQLEFYSVFIFKKTEICILQKINKKVMKKNCLLFLLIFTSIGFRVFPQVYFEVGFTQPPELLVTSLDTLTITSGDEIQIGGNDIVTGGVGTYNFTWQPDSTLDFNDLSNPNASPSDTTIYQLTITDNNGCTVTAYQTVNVDEDTGIKDKIGEFTVEISPNPNQGFFNISIRNDNPLENLKIYIFNVTGKLIYENEINQKVNSYINRIDLTGYAKGNYVIHIIANNLSLKKKLVIQ